MKSRLTSFFGFTLIELMIAVAIIAILAAIAYPSYQDSVRKSRRSDAIAALTDLQLQQEKWRANHPTYTNGLVFPTSNYYIFGVTNNTATAYTLTATAISGKGQDQDKADGTTCTPLTIDQSSTKTPAVCWRK